MNRLASAGFLSVLAVCAIAAARPSQAAPPPDAAPRSTAAEIKELQQKRIELLERVVKILSARYRVGRADFTELQAAQREMLEARLEAAATSAERIQVLEEVQKSHEELAMVVEARIKNGTCSDEEGARAQALVLEVRIKLLRERQAAEPKKK